MLNVLLKSPPDVINAPVAEEHVTSGPPISAPCVAPTAVKYGQLCTAANRKQTEERCCASGDRARVGAGSDLANCRGEIWVVAAFGSVVARKHPRDAVVARCGEDGDAAHPELHRRRAEALHHARLDLALGVAVADRDDVGGTGVGLHRRDPIRQDVAETVGREVLVAVIPGAGRRLRMDGRWMCVCAGVAVEVEGEWGRGGERWWVVGGRRTSWACPA